MAESTILKWFPLRFSNEEREPIMQRHRNMAMDAEMNGRTTGKGNE